jgi:hypothetical protein
MQSQNIAPWPLPNFTTEISERKYRAPWTPVLVFSPVQTNTIYLGTQYVMKTIDGGLHWQTISPDLTGAKKGDGSKPEAPVTLENAKERGYGVVYTIAPSPLSATEIWAGSDTGLIHLTRDGGKTWSKITPSGVSEWNKITQIECSHFSRGEAYAAVDRHRLDDMRPYLYRTRDYGKSWQPIVQGIAGHAFLNSIREDSKRKGLLFAGTEFGVYVSFNDGENWQPLQLNLPVTSVRDLVVHEDDLVIATHGRAFWILDDIAALRQIGPNMSSADVYLYKPVKAFRIKNDSFSGTPIPPEEPQAQNPPRGAYIDYYLRDAATTAITLDIVDAHGDTVRHFSSGEKSAAVPANAAIAPRWFPKPEQLREQRGMHRFVWDLRHGRVGEKTSADVEETGIESWIGPTVLPGTYQVKLTVNGRNLSQPLEVAMDPRSQMTRAELEAQFRWGQHVFEDLLVARKAEREVRALQARLAQNSAKLKGEQATLRDAIASANLTSGEILTGGKQAGEQGLESASRALTIALGCIDGADRVPPSQVIALYQASAKAVKARVAEWEALKQGTLPTLNDQFRSAGLAAIDISDITPHPN